MSLSNSRLLASASVAALVGLMFASPESLARDNRRSSEEMVQELAPLSREAARDIIFEMAPMKPLRKTAVTAKPQPTAAAASKSAEPKLTEAKPQEARRAPDNIVEPPKAVDAAKVEEPAQKPAQSVAEAPPPSNAANAVSAPENAAGEIAPVSEPAKPAETQVTITQETSPSETAVAQPPAPTAELAPSEAVSAQPVIEAETPKIAEEQARPSAAALAPAVVAEPPVAANDNTAPPPAPAEMSASSPAQGEPDHSAVGSEEQIAALIDAGVKGPAEIRIGDRATMWLPAGRTFIALEPAKQLAKEAGVEWRAGGQGLVVPTGEKLSWIAPIELLEDGFVKIGEAGELEAEKLLAAFRNGLPEVNANRTKSGQPGVLLSGWLTAPALDAKHRMSACVNVATESGADAGDKFFNCEAWALGRQGAIKVSLAEGGEEAEKLKGEAAALAETIVYDHGKTYEDFDIAADKVAPYAAADLVTSDVSAKSVALAQGESQQELSLPVLLILKLWKVVLFAIVAIFGVMAWFRRRISGEGASSNGGAALREASMEASSAASQSLLAKMLPSVHALLAKNANPTPPGETQALRDAGVGAVSSRVDRDLAEPNEKAGAGGFLGRFFAWRAKAKSAAPDFASRISEGVDEPISTLNKLASRMRGATPEASPAPVDVARVIRAARSLPGAAPEVDPPAAALMADAAAPGLPVETPRSAAMLESSAPPLNASNSQAPRAPGETPTSLPAHASMTLAEKDEASAANSFGLVEPGDEEAISAVQALRGARA